MTINYEILVKGNSLRLWEGYLGLANLTLIDTNDGPLLVDVGHAVNRQVLVNALGRRGLKPADIPSVFLTHLHYDHVNNIDLFPYETRVFVSRAEWEYAADPHENDPFVPWLIREQLEKYDLTLIEGEGEVSSGVNYFPARGHTPGSYALRFETEDKGRIVIAGDAIKYPNEVIKRASDDCFDTSDGSAETIEHLVSLADRIVPGHYSELVRHGSSFVWEEPSELHLVVR